MDRRAALPLHRLHDEDVEGLLARGERRAELAAAFGTRGHRELSLLAQRAAVTRSRGGPVVYVLPGLMGSRIGTRGRLLDDVVWLDPAEIVAGHLTRLALPRGARLSALGVMLLNALKLKLSLRIAGFDARFHAYDWRLGVEALAAELNARIAADGARDVMLVAHSMGGVVARVALGPGNGRIARVVQVGAPNSGSFTVVYTPRSTCATTRRTSRVSCSGACPRCTSCCRTRRSPEARTSSTSRAGPGTGCVRTRGCSSRPRLRDGDGPPAIPAA